MAAQGHKHSASLTVNQKAQLANAYNELGKELSSPKIRVIGNYTLGKVIGEGSFGTVRMGTHRLTGTRVAIKQVPKAMSAQLTREIHHHRRLHHPHVTQLYEVIATENYIWLVTELCSGGELYDYLIEKGRLSEEETRVIFGQLCLAVGYTHDKGIVHRDLKLENVLLDERCRVKLSDFGFTREFERGSFLETWCGTTGYAAPEMIQCQKYLGQEVDIWSLGVILYTLLTGALPFDDDNEAIQKEKILRVEYEDPEWLSPSSRDLIRNILQREPSKRLSIPQILGHPWFSNPRPTPTSSFGLQIAVTESPAEEKQPPTLGYSHIVIPSDSSDSTSTFHSAYSQSPPTTPDESPINEEDLTLLHLNLSQSTIKRLGNDAETVSRLSTPLKQAVAGNGTVSPDASPTIQPADASITSSSSQSNVINGKGPPTYPTRTPARTKRRSVSSTLSVPSSPTSPSPPNPPQDFIASLNTPTAIVFSTPLERELLSSLSILGFDTAQMVHSVLTNACDSSGALWWMTRRKAERRALDEAARKSESRKDGLLTAPGARTSPILSDSSESGLEKPPETPVETLSVPLKPDLSVLPPTPTLPESREPRTPSPEASPVMLSPHNMTPTCLPQDLHQRASFSVPNQNQNGNKGRSTKPRSASVSMLQRATTALEAAGLVRKKSDEKFRREELDREKEKEREYQKLKEKEKEKEHQKAREKEDKDRRIPAAEEPRSSGNSGKSTKSPPFKPAKDGLPATPIIEPSLLSGVPSTASPWVMPIPASSVPQVALSPTNSPGEIVRSIPATGSVGSANGKQGRARGSILHTFRMWFNEDRKGKRKAAASPHTHPYNTLSHPATTPTSAGSTRGGRPTTKRRSGSGSVPLRRGGHQKRPSASSRRSSSVNSRRSSIASLHKIPMDPQHIPEDPFNPRRRSLGARTPNSERGDYPSRPSSIRSFQVSTPGLPPRRRRSHSPSESSTGSGRRSIRRTDSPLQRYHRRGGSGSSTRVIRQIKTVYPHVRSNSVASSHQSAPSSRPGSYHEASEAEASTQASSPFRPSSRQDNDETPRRAPYSTTVLVAHKKQASYRPTVGRTSWKKSWGMEPPGWKSRSTEAPFEVLFTDDPRTSVSVRDVFSGRPSLSLDDDDWVDEDDDVPFAGGLGQTASANSDAPSHSVVQESFTKAEGFVLAPPPRSSARPQGKHTSNRTPGGRQKGGHSPVSGSMPLPLPVEHCQSENRVSRRQLPGRAEPAFRHAIQEEDEDEE
ncbi:Pkinase-domain-containing protein [Hysterangium stoloniferum]|nr:Pkinase-domain-containing protein [Hysterangium stoloniferum]